MELTKNQIKINELQGLVEKILSSNKINHLRTLSIFIYSSQNTKILLWGENYEKITKTKRGFLIFV